MQSSVRNSLKLTFTYSMFGVQACFATLFGVSQLLASAQSAQGMLFTFLLSNLAFMSLNCYLLFRAELRNSTPETWLGMLSYSLWSCLFNICMLTFIVTSFKQGGLIWDTTVAWGIPQRGVLGNLGMLFSQHHTEFLCVALVSPGLVAVLVYAKLSKLPISDARMLQTLGVVVVGVPQLLFACNILQHGAAGVASLSIVVGHITISTRLCPLLFSKEKWTGERRSVIVTEGANWFTWGMVTAAALYRW